MLEKEISLLDLMVEILLHWRVLIVWMLIGGILMGGFGYVSSYRTMQIQKAKFEEEEKKLQDMKQQLGEAESEGENYSAFAQKEYLQKQMTEIQKNNVDSVLDWESFIEERQTYFNNSILMNIEALNIPQSKLTFLVVADSEEKSKSIELIYEDLVSIGIYQWIADNFKEDISTQVLNEVITLSRSSRALISGGDSFSVSVVYETEEQCKELAGLVAAYMNQQHDLLVEEIGAHDIVLVNEAYSLVKDTSLMDKQRSIKNEITSWKTSVAKMKDAFEEEEWKYYNFLTIGRALGEPVQDGEEGAALDNAQDGQGQQSSMVNSIVVNPPSISIKYIILGMILLAFIYVFYVFVMFIMNNKLRAGDDVSRMYGIPQLGQIPCTNTKKKILPIVDKWILKLRNRGKREFSKEEAIGLAAVAVKISAKREKMNEIYCIGCSMQDKAAEVSGNIENVLKHENISMTVLNNVLYNQEAMERLQGSKGAFLLEQAGETFYEEITKELELLNRQDIKILGIVVME